MPLSIIFNGCGRAKVDVGVTFKSSGAFTYYISTFFGDF